MDNIRNWHYCYRIWQVDRRQDRCRNSRFWNGPYYVGFSRQVKTFYEKMIFQEEITDS